VNGLEPGNSQDAFVEQYRRLCAHIAWRFVFRQKRQHEADAGAPDPIRPSRSSRGPYATVSGPLLPKTDHLAAQDLTSAALLRLVKCPARYRDQPAYVRRLIVNAIIDEQKRQQKIFHSEYAAPALPDGEDWFDTQPGRDGLAQATQIKFDALRAIQAMDCLTQGERLVVEFYFGLNGVQPLKEHAIACKLARTRFWVERRLTAALIKLRTQVGGNSGYSARHG
jgi:RNA polymerase sigma factor (sigma-70 family)